MTTNHKEVARMVENSHQNKRDIKIHPAWLALMRHCQEIGFGEIERLKIQNGVPVMAEKSIQRIKLI